MKYRHSMPWGAEYSFGSGTRFRLWAPSASRVDVVLKNRDVGMFQTGGGWFEATAFVSAGADYLFRIDGGMPVPDPASRFNPGDVHTASVVIDPHSYDWRTTGWTGRPWHDAVIYEVHVGAFTTSGDFAGVESKLEYLVDLGITAIELMPIADFPGARNWGYDGVLQFAPDASYGTPDELKHLVDAAHRRGLMVFLDVVYNHFGPDGNYLSTYAKPFFKEDVHTAWGAAINFDRDGSEAVRDFFIQNALYWIEEFRMDGLRLDAVHAIQDDSQPGFLTELADALRNGPGRARHVHLILENDRNEASLLSPSTPGGACAIAQWNDDVHNALHVIATGENEGYYEDFAERPLSLLGRALAEGFAYQGAPSRYKGGEFRGEDSTHLPATAFVSFLQNHDQVGNRAFGERLGHLIESAPLHAAVDCLLLAPQIPLIFMGDEFNCSSPFLYFCDHCEELAPAINEGRKREFENFRAFRENSEASIPLPTDERTFQSSKVDWDTTRADTSLRSRYRRLLELRALHIAPKLDQLIPGGTYKVEGVGGLQVNWRFKNGATLQLTANFSDEPAGELTAQGASFYANTEIPTGRLPPWSVQWSFVG